MGLSIVLSAPAAAVPFATDSATTNPLVASIPLVAAVVGAVTFAICASWRERTARREDSQRSALYELQDASLKCRRKMAKLSKRIDTARAEPEQDAVDDATAKLRLLMERVLCDIVRERVDKWLVKAEGFFTNEEGVYATDEDEAWRACQQSVGEELRRLAR